MTQKPLGQVCNKLECPWFEVGYSKDCHEFDHAYKPNGQLDESICLACPTVRAPQKVTKKLTTGFPVCDLCFAHYEPALKAAAEKIDKVCPQCEKPYGLGFAGFCSEKCSDDRMDHFTKGSSNTANTEFQILVWTHPEIDGMRGEPEKELSFVSLSAANEAYDKIESYDSKLLMKYASAEPDADGEPLREDSKEDEE